jgi:hypothetical protein
VETRKIAAVAVKKAALAKAELTGGLERARGLLPQKTGRQ